MYCHTRNKYIISSPLHLQVLEVVKEGRVVGRAETSDGVPAAHGAESLSSAETTAGALVARSDISPNLGVLVDGWVDEAENLLAGSETLIVDAVEDGSHQRCRHGGTASLGDLAVEGNDTVVTEGGDIGVATTSAVVNTASLGYVSVSGVVALERRAVRGKEGVDGVLLVVGSGVDVAETTTGGE